MIDRRGEITPNMRVSKLTQYDRLTAKCLKLAERMRAGKPNVTYQGLEINPRFLFGMYRTRDRAFSDYRLVNENQTN